MYKIPEIYFSINVLSENMFKKSITYRGYNGGIFQMIALFWGISHHVVMFSSDVSEEHMYLHIQVTESISASTWTGSSQQEHGGSMFFRNVGADHHYTVLKPQRTTNISNYYWLSYWILRWMSIFLCENLCFLCLCMYKYMNICIHLGYIHHFPSLSRNSSTCGCTQ